MNYWSSCCLVTFGLFNSLHAQQAQQITVTMTNMRISSGPSLTVETAADLDKLSASDRNFLLSQGYFPEVAAQEAKAAAEEQAALQTVSPYTREQWAGFSPEFKRHILELGISSPVEEEPESEDINQVDHLDEPQTSMNNENHISEAPSEGW